PVRNAMFLGKVMLMGDVPRFTTQCPEEVHSPQILTRFFFLSSVTLPKPLPPPSSSSSSPSKPTRRSMQSSYRLPTPLPQLPVRKGVRGRRPKSETIALLKALAASAAAAQNSAGPQPDTIEPTSPLTPRPHKKRGPKPGSKRKPKILQSPLSASALSDPRLSQSQQLRDSISLLSSPSSVVSTVCVYVNKHGNCGPHLDRKQVQRLPDHFGPEAVNLVLQQTVQACLDCAYQPKVLLGCLQNQPDGGEVVRVRTDGGTRMVKLPSASSAAFVLRYLEMVCRHLQCDNLFSSQPFSPCSSYERSKSVKEELSEAPALNRGLKRISRDSPPYSAPLSPKLLRTDTHPSEAETLPPEENGLLKEQRFMDSASNSMTPRPQTLRSTSEYQTQPSSPYYHGSGPPLRRHASNPPARTHRRVEDGQMAFSYSSPQDAPHRTLPTGRSPQDAPHRTLPTGRSPLDAPHRTLPTGRSPLDAPHRTLPTGRSPLDAPHRTLPTGRSPLDGPPLDVLATLPTLARRPQETTHWTLPTRTPQDAPHRPGTLPTGRSPTGRSPQDAPHYERSPLDRTIDPTGTLPTTGRHHRTLPTGRVPTGRTGCSRQDAPTWAASSTTGPDAAAAECETPRSTSSRSPSLWSIEEVMQFVRDADPAALAPHAELFRKHEIDGKALMLLRSDMVMKYMGLKLGPALKLCYHIERLKQGKQ
ncbi:hypothetical protein NFI96_026643, partial [Prochilodus magdalenae]